MEQLDPEVERLWLEDVFDLEADHKMFRKLGLTCILILSIIIFCLYLFLK